MNATDGQDAPRALELSVAVLSGLAGLFLLVMSVGGTLIDFAGSEAFDWKLLMVELVVCLVGAWCAQIAWRLVTRREQRGGGLISPLVLILISIGCASASIAWFVLGQQNEKGVITLMAVALTFFSLALSRIQKRKRGRPAA